ncbi:hypothetical protein THAOC_01727, partial [Thalassiosira oceanica]
EQDAADPPAAAFAALDKGHEVVDIAVDVPQRALVALPDARRVALHRHAPSWVDVSLGVGRVLLPMGRRAPVASDLLVGDVPQQRLALASSRRAEETQQHRCLQISSVGRTGSADGRRTGRGLRRMPWEGGSCAWLGSVCLTSGWGGAFSISGVRGARCRITATSPAERGDGERIGVPPCVEDGRMRQYTAAGGAPVVQTPEVIGYEARGWRGRSAGWELGCIARASAFESVSALNTMPPVNEDIHMRRLTGRLVLQE